MPSNVTERTGYSDSSEGDLMNELTANRIRDKIGKIEGAWELMNLGITELKQETWDTKAMSSSKMALKELEALHSIENQLVKAQTMWSRLRESIRPE